MRGWPGRMAGGLPRTFWLLWAGTLINRLGSFVIIFLAIYLTGERDFSQSQAGLVIGLYGAGGAAGTIGGGVLTDRWGRRPTLLTAQFGAAALMLTLGFAHEYGPILTVAFLLGVFTEAARPAFAAMMIDVVPEPDRIRAFSLYYWAINLGFAVAAVSAGLAAQVDYLLLFVADAGTTVLSALIGVFFLSETRPARARAARVTAGPGLGTVFRDRSFVGFLLLNLCGVIVLFQHMSTLPIAMLADGLGPGTFGWVIAVNGVLIVCGQLFVPRLIEGRSRPAVLALATLIVGVGFGLVALAGSAWFFALTVVIWTLGEMLQSPSYAALVAELSPAALRGRYQGVSSLSWSAGAAVAPVAGGFVQEHLGDATLWLGCFVVCAVVAAGQLASGPAWERRITRLRTAEAALTPDAVPEQSHAPPTQTDAAPEQNGTAPAPNDATPNRSEAAPTEGHGARAE